VIVLLWSLGLTVSKFANGHATEQEKNNK